MRDPWLLIAVLVEYDVDGGFVCDGVGVFLSFRDPKKLNDFSPDDVEPLVDDVEWEPPSVFSLALCFSLTTSFLARCSPTSCLSGSVHITSNMAVDFFWGGGANCLSKLKCSTLGSKGPWRLGFARLRLECPWLYSEPGRTFYFLSSLFLCCVVRLAKM